MSDSFSDTRQAVQAALTAADKDHGKDLSVVDLGPGWVVYNDPDTDGPGLHRRSYEFSDGHVKFTGDPVKVTRQTTYSAEGEDQPKTLKEAGIKVREHFRRARSEARGQ